MGEDKLSRFGISMEASLLAEFDDYCRRRRYPNRSEAIRDLIRKSLIEEEWKENRETVAALTLVYDHHVPGLTEKLTRFQHDFPGQVIAALHVHLGHHACLETIVARGKALQIKTLADRLIALRGVKHGALTGTTAKI
jgi:CopG family transcriptional regulator, nickel-responsive regulator